MKKQYPRRPGYDAWKRMIRRCHDPRCWDWKYYGGRGITVCLRWQRSFADFLADMGLRPSGLTLDRIDSEGNYEPGNCRWASRSVQNFNKRTSNKHGWRGVVQKGSFYAQLWGMDRTSVRRDGPFSSSRMAALAFNELARIQHGDEYSHFNQVFSR